MSESFPESNAEIVALNIVSQAIVDEVNSPGNGLAELFITMAKLARDLGGDFRAAEKDWWQTIENGGLNDSSEIQGVVDRQALAIGETWSKRWILSALAKHVHLELQRKCLESPAASVIEKIDYESDGRVKSWSQHKP